MTKYFVWVSGPRGPEAQLWNDKPVDGNGKAVKNAIFTEKLSPELEHWTLDQLILKFNNRKPCQQD